MFRYFKLLGKKRLFGMICGVILIGIGICIFKLSGMGNDPFSGMAMALAERFSTNYSTLVITVNTCIFILEVTLGRKYIGIGTFVNWFLVGFVAEFFIWVSGNLVILPSAFFPRLLIVMLGVLIISLGVSLYQTSKAGIAPYDSISLMATEHLQIPYFWCRITCDALCTIICLLTGGLVGLGTFLCAFCLGPFIQFFNKKVSEKLMSGVKQAS